MMTVLVLMVSVLKSVSLNSVVIVLEHCTLVRDATAVSFLFLILEN